MLDPLVEKFLANLALANIAPIEETPVDVSRRSMLAASNTLGEAPQIAQVQNIEMPGPGGALRLRVYHPDPSRLLPVVAYYHGGGWVLGDLDTHDGLCRRLAHESQAVVVSVDYRLAPEHPFPAAVDDAYAALLWIAENSAQLGVLPDRLSVAGDSAGGNLAAVVAMLARDASGPVIRSQVLIYPVTDHRFETRSYTQHAEDRYLTRDSMIWFWNQYVPNESDRTDWRASPLRADNLANLPPALVITAAYDPLCDEGEAYAERLTVAGTRVTLTRYNGMIHGFIRRANQWPDAQKAVETIAKVVG